MTDQPQMELRCPHCSHVERCTSAQMLARLQTAGVMRRSREPDPSLVLELFTATSGRFACQQCGREGLTCREAQEDGWDDWGSGKPCESCRQPIASERLEVFPQTKLCSRCQAQEESGGSEEVEYCPRCGDIMTTRLDSRGTSRYVMACPSCGVRA